MEELATPETVFAPPLAATESTKVGEKLAPFNPTSSDAIDIALRLLDLVEGDVVFDLGAHDTLFSFTSFFSSHLFTPLLFSSLLFSSSISSRIFSSFCPFRLISSLLFFLSHHL
jgi:hypothetical protein